MTINLPEASPARRDSVAVADTSRGALARARVRSARAAAKAQLKAEGSGANADDIRIAKQPSTQEPNAEEGSGI